ncbi:MAG: altronate dehydratase [Proteobacteria bacterium]|nr:altronate dehydratase [Pseudomonadota bacterium]
MARRWASNPGPKRGSIPFNICAAAPCPASHSGRLRLDCKGSPAPCKREGVPVSDVVSADAVAVRLHPSDNVVVATRRIAPGTRVEGIAAREAVPSGHKIATAAIPMGSAVRKYGQVIGVATADIAPGAHVHTQNLAMSDLREAASGGQAWNAVQAPKSFRGFRRANGKTGVRNYIGVLTSVNCSATVARHIAEAAERQGLLRDFGHVDGIVPIVHSSGCGMANSGDGFDILKRTLWGTAANANFGAVLLVGLGCEMMQIDRLKKDYGIAEGESFQSYTIQDAGGTRRAIEEGLARLKTMLPVADRARREEVPASELVLGLQCGGSDAWSGVTSNPALGNASDRLAALGATVILSETPEIYGAEHLLYARARASEVSTKLRARLDWWEHYTRINGAEMNNNPSPGNKAGGLTTILEKSLGAVAKAGTSPLNDVIEYAAPLRERGLNFMDSPGFDPASATGQVASGATMIAFTTGRGSAYGCKPSPSIKLASNSEIYARMKDDIDIDCGGIARGLASVEDKGAEVLDLLLRVASGEKSKSEELGYGGAEFVPWQVGAVM